MIPEPRGRLSVLEKGSSAPAVSGLHACATDTGPSVLVRSAFGPRGGALQGDSVTKTGQAGGPRLFYSCCLHRSLQT